MKRSLILFLFVYFLPFAKAQVSFKNTGTSRLFIAICTWEASSGWTTKGWYTLEPQEDKVLYQPKLLSNPNFYYCAKIENCDRGYFGDVPLTIHQEKPFQLPNADKPLPAQAQGYTKLNFIKVNLQNRQQRTITLQPTNLTCNGVRTGKWRIPLDKYGEYAEKMEDADGYREVTFSNGRPIGWCKDFYSGGQLWAEFKLLQLRPVVYDGNCKWYSPEGKLTKEISYANGQAITQTQFAADGSKTTEKRKLKIVELPLQQHYLNSTSNEFFKGGRSKVCLHVTLPKNTVEWYYEFTAARDEATQKRNVASFQLASQLAGMVDQTGILSGSINLFTTPPGADYCDILLIDAASQKAFLEESRFNIYNEGTRKNFKSGIVQVKDINISNPMLALENRDMSYGINVSVKIVAIVSEI